MPHARLLLLFALVLAGLVPAVVLGANTSSSLPLAGAPRIHLSVDAEGATVDETDPGTNRFKRAAVIACTVSGQAVVLLVRAQVAPNGLFIDAVVDDTNANVSTRLASMNLSSRGHPSPTSDAIDTAIMTAAAAD